MNKNRKRNGFSKESSSKNSDGKKKVVTFRDEIANEAIGEILEREVTYRIHTVCMLIVQEIASKKGIGSEEITDQIMEVAINCESENEIETGVGRIVNEMLRGRIVL